MFFFCSHQRIKMDMFTLTAPQPATVPSPPTCNVVRTVEAVLSLPEAKLDYARAKIVLDALVDPELDAERTLATL